MEYFIYRLSYLILIGKKSLLYKCLCTSIWIFQDIFVLYVNFAKINFSDDFTKKYKFSLLQIVFYKSFYNLIMIISLFGPKEKYVESSQYSKLEQIIKVLNK